MPTTPVAERSNEVERQVSDTSNSPYRPNGAVRGRGRPLTAFRVDPPSSPIPCRDSSSPKAAPDAEVSASRLCGGESQFNRNCRRTIDS